MLSHFCSAVAKPINYTVICPNVQLYYDIQANVTLESVGMGVIAGCGMNWHQVLNYVLILSGLIYSSISTSYWREVNESIQVPTTT